ncbi:hypothetical protein Ancab_016912, partial [Ancistrocladus abbreviatus]
GGESQLYEPRFAVASSNSNGGITRGHYHPSTWQLCGAMIGLRKSQSSDRTRVAVSFMGYLPSHFRCLHKVPPLALQRVQTRSSCYWK